jgi:hypothetical protein
VERRTLDVRHDVRGPAGEPGFLLIAPPSEALDWDIQHEIASTCRYWMANHQAWWIAAPYLSTAWEILERLDPKTESPWKRFLRARLSPQLGLKLDSLASFGGSLRSTANRVWQ